MTHSAFPSSKGQITIPFPIRKKYGISENTPVQIIDSDNGVIQLRIMSVIDYSDIEYFENDTEVGLKFRKGIDPKVLIDKIQEIDG
ncbi:AbrB/MazE/SpoVT family DNA-binding domain-containing protein [Candidatus Peregrinibacteria bacterium]|nr:AbrB/MazE/SpoVT family DNA-binding domain-containing protein [Candidatus Peregrinibacteria bacterium]